MQFCDSYTLEMDFKKFCFCFCFLVFVLPRRTNSFSIKFQAWFTNGRECSNFLGFFFPFLNTSRKKMHFNTFHKNTLFRVYAHSLAGGESYNEGACF